MSTTRKLLLPLALAAALSACSKPADQAAPAADQPAPAAEAPAPVAAEAPAADAIKPVSGTYTLDPSHTDVLAQWTHFGFSKPSAHFGISEGTLTYDADDVTKSSVAVTIPLSTLDTFVPKLDEHLKGSDFFDAAKFPDATFKSTQVQAAGTNKLAVTGDLTIKDVTKPVTLEVTLNGAGEHPMAKKQAIGFSATGTVKRTDFGVGAYAPNVSDEVQLSITTEGLLDDAPAAK
ncbi:YceI family protein [Xanthomonas massiliensis]|jgi:polyisoprenoid-binding protein YceI|uniref:YceI family protein n=1 Tax=Xanthomonas massiliensis TaxID=1720302 RepID=UPI00098EC5B8|nr:YceI family protein [Xanthomonas massiliensis]